MTSAVPAAPRSPLDSRPSWRILVLAAVWAVVITVVVCQLVINGRDAMISQVLGSVSILAAILFCLVFSVRAAWKSRVARKAWGMIAIAMVLSAISQLGFVEAALTQRATETSPLSDAIGVIGYAVPFFAALWFFPRPADRLISRARQVLDVAVITAGLVLISEATVLSTVRESTDLSSFSGWLRLFYPVIDIGISAAVLALGMRQRPGDRLTWLVLGTGMVILSVTDSIYVREIALGGQNLLSSPLVAGWMLTPVLIGLSAMIPFRSHTTTGSVVSLAIQLLPYVPIFGAITVLSFSDPLSDPFLFAIGAALLFAVAVRQVMIVYENVSLTRNLEREVAGRTKELDILGSIMTSTGDAVVGVSLENRITAWNPAAEALFGYRAEDVIGHRPDFLAPSTYGNVEELLTDAARGQGTRLFEADWPRPDGTSVPVAMTVSPIVADGEIQGISVIAGDITERRRTAAILEQTREEALESSRLKSEFLATMSHEIRTPMNGVIGLTTLLLETELDVDQRQYAEGVRGAGEALLAVINDVLDFSKLEAGKVVLEETDFDPRRLLDEIGALLAPTADAKGLELIAYCKPEVPPQLRGDPGRLRQILLNLASNAVKFTAAGEVVIKVGTEPTQVAGSSRVRLRGEVVDTGIGIADKDQPRLFQSFSQADASTTRRFGGTGLGLAICRRLVEVMGGEIGVTSETGVGSTFWFEVPLSLGLTELPPAEPSVDVLRGRRVLIVDDNQTNRTILTSQLQSWGMHADAAVDANMGLEWLQSRADEGYPYDLAALDMCMPGTDGLELAQLINADPSLQGMPLLMLTSSGNPEPVQLQQAGIGECVVKPVRSSELYERLVKLLRPLEEEVLQRRDTAATPQRAALPGSRGALLLVEDNELNQLVAEAVVGRLGFRVDKAADGFEALQLLQQNRYLGVLMDCHMPHMDGFSATREIRRREDPSSRIPIIAMTAGAMPEDRERCLAAGMDAYVSKPIDIDRLDAMLDAMTGEEYGPLPAQAPDDGHPDGPPIDPGRLADLSELASADGTGLLQTLVTSFVERSQNRLEVVRAAEASGDTRVMGDAAHELKGAAGTIGAVRVAQLCRELETSVRSGRPLRADLLDQLSEELEIAVRELQGLEQPA